MGTLHTIGTIAFRVYANDHRPAHFHVVAPDCEAMVDVATLTVFRGPIPARDRRVVMERATANQARIVAAWNELNPDLAI